MGIQEKIKKADLSKNTSVTLVYSAGEDVIHARDGYEDQVVESTGIARSLANLVTDPNFKNNEVLEGMRAADLLWDYPRDGSGFTEYVETVLKEYLHDYEWVDYSTEHYDHKRGFTTVEARVETTVEEVLNVNAAVLDGWDAEVKTTLGNTTIKGG
tara:strand:- start:1746 stop:2213 length:468 start_codon:yes stop_codon:yes gene_type:complete